MASYYTRSKVHRPDTPIAEGSDVESYQMSPLLLRLLLQPIHLWDQVLWPQESPGPSTEPTGSASAPIRPSSVGMYPSEGRPGVVWPVGSPQVGFPWAQAVVHNSDKANLSNQYFSSVGVIDNGTLSAN